MSESLEDIDVPGKETLGNLLQRTRRGQQKTLGEAAEATRISQGALAAIEADDFNRLSAEVFTRGFIKIYAKYLGLDSGETLKHYISQENADPDKPADRPYRRDIFDGAAMAHAPNYFKNRRRPLTVILLLSVLVGLYILGKIYNSDEQQAGEAMTDIEISRPLVQEPPQAREMLLAAEPDPGTTTPSDDGSILPESVVPAGENPIPDAEPEIIPVKPEPKPAPAKPRAPVSLLKPAPVTPPASATTQAAQAVQPAPTRPAAASVAPRAVAGSTVSQPALPVTVKVATTAVDGTEAEAPVTTSTAPGQENYVLEARFWNSSWVHVEIDDQPVRQYTSQPGVTRVWRANRRLLLKLDNAEAVELTLNGKPLPLKGKLGELTTVRIPPELP
jgi:cytoskeleton protein RodZ